MKSLIPDAALDKHVALLGMTGAGKSSVVKTAIVEPDLSAERRVVIITPKDDWWGLRLSKNGKAKGFDIPIFGGWHADYPLQVKDAALLAEAYGTMKGSAIFCTSRLSVQDRARWFSSFAEALLSKNKGWLRVVIDEAHVFMPKQGGKGGGAIPAALHAGNELVSQGRSLGLRIVLASQRSAKLHNDSLTQCSCLLAMQLMAPHDRQAVKDWIEDQADPEKGKEIIASLANLNTAEAWIWAPRAKMLERRQFPWPKTFDSSAAPDDDTGTAQILPAVNLDALKGKLAKVEAEKKASDPAELKKAVARLEADNRQLQQRLDEASSRPAADPKAIRAAQAEGFEKGRDAAMAAAQREAKRIVRDTLGAVRGGIDGLIADKIREARDIAPAVTVDFVPSALPTQKMAVVDDGRGLRRTASGKASYKRADLREVKAQFGGAGGGNGSAGNTASDAVLPTAARKMLAVMDTTPPVKRSWNQVAAIAGLRARGGHYNTGRKALVESGLVIEDGGLVSITTPSGNPSETASPEDMVRLWGGILTGAGPKILQNLFDAGGSKSRTDVAESLGVQPRGGHWNTAWKELKDNGIVTVAGDVATLTELFHP